MALTGSESVTITLDRSIVKRLRAKKRGLETWDQLMLRLLERVQGGVECIRCGRVLKAGGVQVTQRMIAEKSGWKEVKVDGNVVGFACTHCWLDLEEPREG